jgi:cell division protein FtsL
MVDRDLAELYQVSTSRLNEQVKRNSEKFPSDFMFELTDNEKNELIAKCDNLQKLKFNPSKVKVFTEHGVYM